jgi:hypothetical protein
LIGFLVKAKKATKWKFEDRFDWEVKLDAAVQSPICVILLAILPGEKPTIPKSFTAGCLR